jgi:hypothetical protein
MENSSRFESIVFGGHDLWDRFIEMWTVVIYDVVAEALGEYGTEPGSLIIPMSEGFHLSGATASFNMGTGQVTLSPSVHGSAGTILEKLTHEFIHGSLSQFPEGDPFYEEGQVDYATFLLAHCPVWGVHREAMIEAAKFNIDKRFTRAQQTDTDYDRKRWSGGMYARLVYGKNLIGRLRMKKMEGDFTW